MLRWPVEPMRAAAVRSLPELPRVQDPRFELKFDGWRCLAWVGRDSVELQSRQGRSLTRWFPDVCRALAGHIPAGTLLDGELLSWDTTHGCTSFTHLQRRITAGRRLSAEIDAHPAHLVLFDVLRDGRGRSLLNEPLQARRRRLERLLRGAPPQLVLCPQTADPVEAQVWFSDMGVTGVEGLVVKPAASRYLPGQAGWVKVKARASTELIVGGVTGTIAEPVALLVGRFDENGGLRYLGQTHPVCAGMRREVGRLLQPMTFHGDGSGHPWPVPLPAAWSLNLTDRRPLAYTPVEPHLVVEVEVDAAQDGRTGRYRHGARLIRCRPDLTCTDVDRLTLTTRDTQRGMSLAPPRPPSG